MKSTLKYILLLTIIFNGFKSVAQGQRGNLPNYYKEKLNLGVTLGLNKTNFLISAPPHFENFDSLKSVTYEGKRGFNIGLVSEIRLSEYFMLRFTPSFAFGDRVLKYSFEGEDTIVRSKPIESFFLLFPLDLKLRSKRVNNFGAYVVVGGGFCYDKASKQNAVTSINPVEQIVKLKHNDLFYEMGAGTEFYFEYFKFAIEGKLSIGTQNVLVKDNTIFSNSIDKLKSKVFLISITFEG